MTPSRDIDILLVENDSSDAELAIHTLRKHNLANSVHVVEDGERRSACRGRRRQRKTRGNEDRSRHALRMFSR